MTLEAAVEATSSHIRPFFESGGTTVTATMLRARGVVPRVAPTTPQTDDPGRARARGLNVLRWIGLLVEDDPVEVDELALQSLTGDHYGDDTSLWIA